MKEDIESAPLERQHVQNQMAALHELVKYQRGEAGWCSSACKCMCVCVCAACVQPVTLRQKVTVPCCVRGSCRCVCVTLALLPSRSPLLQLGSLAFANLVWDSRQPHQHPAKPAYCPASCCSCIFLPSFLSLRSTHSLSPLSLSFRFPIFGLVVIAETLVIPQQGSVATNL